MKHVQIWTDASYSDKRGGWAAVLKFKAVEKHISGSVDYANDACMMEMLAIVKALEAIKEPCKASVYTDSQPAIRIIKGQSKTKNKSAAVLLRKLSKLQELHKVHFFWVRGHSKSERNNIADKLAREQRMLTKEKWNLKQIEDNLK